MRPKNKRGIRREGTRRAREGAEEKREREYAGGKGVEREGKIFEMKN